MVAEAVADDVVATPHWVRLGVALSVFAISIVCGLGLMEQGVTGEDRFAASGVALMLWFAGAVAAAITWFTIRRVSAARVAVVTVLVFALVGSTLYEVRPQAPTGQDHPELLADGNALVTTELTELLDQTLPSRWELRFVASPYSCTDWLGRSRGAAQITSYVNIRPHLRLVELEVIADQLRTGGWEVTMIPHDFGDQQGQRLNAVRNGYSLTVDATFDELTVYRDGRVSDDQNQIDITTPCLRS